MAVNAASDELEAIIASSQNRTEVHPEDDPRYSHRHAKGISSLNLSDSEDDDNQHEPTAASAPNIPTISGPGGNYILPKSQFNGNTGVKGVIADARDFDRARREDRAMRKTEINLSSLALDGRNGEHRSLMKSQRHEPETVDSDSDPELENDDEFMARWRSARLNTVVSYADRPASNVRNAGLMAVDAETYLTIVDSSSAHLTVIVLIHNPESDDSIDIAEALDEVASSHGGKQRFIMLGHEDAEMSEAGVPALLVYRNGDLIDTLVRLQDIVASSAGKGSLANKLRGVLRS
jgi:hypothetical protein